MDWLIVLLLVLARCCSLDQADEIIYLYNLLNFFGSFCFVRQGNDAVLALG